MIPAKAGPPPSPARSIWAEGLVSQLNRLPDTEAQQVAHSLPKAVRQLHGTGLDRMMDINFDQAIRAKKRSRENRGGPKQRACWMKSFREAS